MTARSLFAESRDETFTERLPSLLILCETIFSCVTAMISLASTFGFTRQKDVFGVVGLKTTGIPVARFFRYVTTVYGSSLSVSSVMSLNEYNEVLSSPWSLSTSAVRIRLDGMFSSDTVPLIS